jgi:hypothetical protein
MAIVERIICNVAGYRPWSAVGPIGVLRTTGPIAYSLGLHPVLEKHPHRRIRWHEIRARPSIGGDYHHFAVFKNHYSLRTDPVVRLGPLGPKLSRLFVSLRKISAQVTGSAKT